ncbi:aldo/keto reductase [Pedobacter psychrophilus]|uniref:Aldo/keto reductase n=1 Tax=Pedobacter psychrophilus TaxID=1826909 RepID=A0A179DIJ8_9SPHI|nr:aldo/keto reductase [Pedobacter psychrophilus]OAQ40831.1 aldo/keto reductase [Pedobacter psychrophilus]
MEKIYLSDAGPKVSPAVYGFYRWNDLGTELPQKMEEIFNFCFDLGINTFDHADIYGNYSCEEEFGKLIQRSSVKREDLVLFTKCGLCEPHSSKPNIKTRYLDSSAKHINECLHQSLKNLKTDYVDVFLLNNLDPIADLEETAAQLLKLKQEGKIKTVGLSNFNVFQHQLLSSYLKLPIVTNHVELNLLNTNALENGQIDYMKQKYMRPFALAPLAEGRIATGMDLSEVVIREKLNILAEKYNTNIESVAVAWLLKLGALPLIGTRNKDRIKNIVAAFDIELDRQDWHNLYNSTRLSR